MTNEKDREEARKLCEKLRVIVNGENCYPFDKPEHIDNLAAWIACIRAEAVQAERERCRQKVNNLDSKLPAFRRSTYQEGYGDAISDAEQAILSNDQEANRG